ncbi:MAG: hypothetical protein H7Y15_00495, partial [Pseudonocardia sp.]|nr:hypothetical protein [Pseudonocardia sp.]
MDDDHRPDVRLHAPCAGVVVVRVAGSVEEGAARGLHDTLHSQLPRATHVILDLADVRA